jgi:hypothetical protein
MQKRKTLESFPSAPAFAGTPPAKDASVHEPRLAKHPDIRIEMMLFSGLARP